MTKDVLKRFISLALTVLMVVSAMPFTVLTAFAATTLSDLTVDDLSVTYTNGSWSASGSSISGSVTGESGCTNSSTSCTLVFTNNKTETAKLSFNYTVELNSGSLTVGGTSITSDGTYSYSGEIEDDSTLQIVLTSASGDYTSSLSITDISLIVESNVTTTFTPAENGSYTVDGTEITADTTSTQLSTVAYSLVATPADGYQFLGWYSVTNENFLSTSADVSLYIGENQTVTAIFGTADAAVFETGGGKFTDLNEAVAYAQKVSTTRITLVADGTLPAGDYTIPSGYELLIPYNDSYSANFSETPTTTTTNTTPSQYSCLTMADGANIICDGAINVNAQQYTTSSRNPGHVSGPYGAIYMESGSTITMNSGSNLYCYGYIGGDGVVEGMSGSQIYELMQIEDWRGGNNTSTLLSSLSGNSFVFSQYYVQNVEATLKVNYGSVVTACATVSVSVLGVQQINADVIGTSSGLFRLSDGYVTLGYDGSTDRMNLDVYGNMSTENISMSISGLGTFDSSKYILAIPANYSVDIKDGASVSFSQKFKMLPGVEINIEDGAVATVESDGALYLYDADDWNTGTYTYASTIYRVNYVFRNHNNKSGSPYARKADTDALLNVDGVLIANGPIYTTNSSLADGEGGDAAITGSGVYISNTIGSTDLLEVSGNSTTTVTIECEPVVGSIAGYEDLQSFAAGVYYGTSDAASWYQYVIYGAGYILTSGGESGSGSLTRDTYNTSGTVASTDTFDNVIGYVAATNDNSSISAVIESDGTVCTGTPTVTGAAIASNGDGTFTVSDVTTNVALTAIDHTTEIQNAKDATCTEDGYTGDEVCTVCGETISTGEAIPATGHTEGEAVEENEVAATYTKKGSYDLVIYCTVCDEEISRETVEIDYLYGWSTDENGKTYYSGGTFAYIDTWAEIDGSMYYFGSDGYVLTGIQRVSYPDGYGPAEDDIGNVDYTDSETSLFIFDEDGVFQSTQTGFVTVDGETRWAVNGQIPWHAGLVQTDDGTYYYFSCDGMVTDCTYYITKTNDLLSQGYYVFDENGAAVLQYGIVYENGAYYYYNESGAKEYAGLIYLDGYYYYVRSNFQVVHDTTYYVSKTNGLMDAGYYTFDSDGKMVVLNGIVKETEDTWYYYVNGSKTYAGLIEIDGDYYYVRTNCEVVHDATYYITKTNDLMSQGYYTFDEDGKMVILDGIVKESEDTWYYYVDNAKVYAGLIEIDGDYYYVRSNFQVVHDATYYVSKTNGLMDAGYYTFDSDGKMVVLNGIVKETEDTWYYYVNGVKTYAGLIEIDGDYYYVRTNCEVVHDATYYITKTNDLMSQGYYTFDEDGKMVLLNGIVKESDDTWYYYVDNAKVYAGLIEIDGDYYYVNSSFKVVHDCEYCISKTNDLMPQGKYKFDSEGKMVVE